MRAPSNMSASNERYLQDGIRNIMKICLCDLVLGEEPLLRVMQNLQRTMGIERVVLALLKLDDMKSENKVKKKNRKPFLHWLDNNVSADCLSDRLFEIMEKI